MAITYIISSWLRFTSTSLCYLHGGTKERRNSFKLLLVRQVRFKHYIFNFPDYNTYFMTKGKVVFFFSSRLLFIMEKSSQTTFTIWQLGKWIMQYFVSLVVFLLLLKLYSLSQEKYLTCICMLWFVPTYYSLFLFSSFLNLHQMGFIEEVFRYPRVFLPSLAFLTIKCSRVSTL